MQQELIVAGTGHRPDKLGGFGAPAHIKLRGVATMWLDEHKPSKVIMGGAIGWDQALGWAAIDLGIPVTAAIPFEGQQNNWPTHSRINYKMLLDKCAEVIIVTHGDHASYKFQRRNEWMVDKLIEAFNHNKKAILLSMWDGTEGGTANCLKYANRWKQKFEIINLYDTWKVAA